MKSMNIKTLALFTADPWESAMPVIRVRAPARFAGVRVLQGNHSDAINTSVLGQCDGIVIQRDFPRFPGCEELIRQARAKKIPVIYECDDMILETPKDHISHTVFIDVLYKILRVMLQADLVVTSTQALADYFKDINPNTHVFPNYLDDSIWTIREKPMQIEKDGPIVIGYMGGASHLPDLELVAPVLLSLDEKYGSRIVYSFWGAPPPEKIKNLGNATWHEMNLQDYGEFARHFGECHADIWIAPLQDIPFNQYKSAIKFMEYTAVGGPTIFSRTRPYTEVIRDGRTGLLASTPADWENGLLRLIEDPELRKKLAVGARRSLVDTWLLSDHYNNWVDTYASGLSDAKARDDHSTRRALVTFLRISEQVENRVASLESEIADLRAQLGKYTHISNSRIWHIVQFMRRMIHRGEG